MKEKLIIMTLTMAMEKIILKTGNYNLKDCIKIIIGKEEKNTISFQFFVGGDKRSYIQSTRLDIYRRSVGIVKKHFARSDVQPGFLNIGRDWAKESLDAYKNSRR